MTTEHHERLQAIFLDAADLAGPARAAFLDEACAGDAGLRSEIEALLACEEDEGEFLEESAVTGLSTPVPVIEGLAIEGEIGRGRKGVVFRGTETFLDRPVAVKVLADRFGLDLFAERFGREARLLASLEHPNIVACHAAGRLPSGERYLVLERIDGPVLAEHLAKTGPLPLVSALAVTADLARALAYAAGRGIIHRDVRAENVLLQPLEGGSGRFPYRPKLADLGLARPVADGTTKTDLAAQGNVLGSTQTMAPEQFSDPDRVDERADIYALGCLLYQMLTATMAFPRASLIATIARKMEGAAPDPRDLTPGLPRPVAAFVRTLLAPHKEDRPGTYAEVLAACEELANPQQSAPSRTVPAPPPRPAPIRGARLVRLVCWVAALGVAGAALWFVLRS